MKNYIIAFASLVIISCGAEKSDKQIETPDELTTEVNAVDSTFLIINEKIRNDIQNPDLYLERAELYFSHEEYVSGKSDLDRAYLLDTNKLVTLIKFSDYWMKIGKLGFALNVLEKAGRIYAENSVVNEKLSELYLIAKDNKKSMEFADLAVKFDIYNAKAYYLKGFNFLEMGDTTLAISSYQTAIEQDPDFYEAYLELGLLFSEMKNKLALQYYKNALEIRPNERNVLYSIGMFQQENEMYNEAIATYYELIKKYPDFREAHYNLGYVHLFYLKLYRDATNYFTDALKVDDRYYEAYYNRGYCFELMGDVNNAKRDYQNALNIYPSYTIAAKGMERITKGVVE